MADVREGVSVTDDWLPESVDTVARMREYKAEARRPSRGTPLMIVGESTSHIQSNVIGVRLLTRERNGSI